MENTVRVTLFVFAGKRYYTDPSEIDGIYKEIVKTLSGVYNESYLITSENDLPCADAQSVAILVPISGAVQPLVLKVGEKHPAVILLPAYVEDFFSKKTAERILELNGAPAVMDSFAVLKRSKNAVLLPYNTEMLSEYIRVQKAYLGIKGSKLLLIGDTEPWVISSSRDHSRYTDILGVEIEKADTDELIRYYQSTKNEDAEHIRDYFKSRACAVKEPTDKDITDCSRLAHAIEMLIRDKGASGAAIACFDLLSRVGATACLGASYINGETDLVLSCEGDLDSAATMLMAKKLGCSAPWMANPNLIPDGSVNFVHCTAPVRMGGDLSFTLRSHHESGIGTSTQVSLPTGKVTAIRFSAAEGKLTALSAIAKKGVEQSTCHTKLHVTFDNADEYLSTVLGCHQVFVFEDAVKKIRLLASLFGM